MSRVIAFFLISYFLFFHLFLLSEPGPYFDYQHPSQPVQRIGVEHNLRCAARRFMQTVENGGSLFASYTVFSGTAKTDEQVPASAQGGNRLGSGLNVAAYQFLPVVGPARIRFEPEPLYGQSAFEIAAGLFGKRLPALRCGPVEPVVLRIERIAYGGTYTYKCGIR